MRFPAAFTWFSLLIIISFTWPATAQWSDQPIANTPVCTLDDHQYLPAMVGDGSSGAIIAWTDQRNGIGTSDIHAQRLDDEGMELWAANGVAVCTTATTVAESPAVVADGAGGSFIAWNDYRATNSDIYVQRLDSSGTPLWTANGVAVCTETSSQQDSQIVLDGAGGVIIIWKDYRASGTEDLYAQRVDSSGTPLWTADGVPVCTAAGNQTAPEAVSDGAGGVIVAWEDFRSSSFDIYLQRIDSSGSPVWAVDGVGACTAVSSQTAPRLIATTAGGAICTWYDYRDSLQHDVYAQRITAAGNPLWTANGVLLCAAANEQVDPDIISDGSNGAIIAWTDNRGTDYDIYAQRLNPAGTALWTVDGVPVCTAAGDQSGFPQIVSSGTGGAVITWRDFRNSIDYDIYGQRIDSSGTTLWAAAGVPFTVGPEIQASSRLIADGADGAILVWTDHRWGNNDVYAQMVDSSGLLGGFPAVSTVIPGIDCTPNMGILPFATTITVTLTNTYPGLTRRMAAHIDIDLAGGGFIATWRAGYANIAAGATYVTSWSQNLPALGALNGLTEFTIVAEDVTPAPYNQPPYPPAGDTGESTSTVEGSL